jgi:hypothetical protein
MGSVSFQPKQMITERLVIRNGEVINQETTVQELDDNFYNGLSDLDKEELDLIVQNYLKLKGA